MNFACIDLGLFVYCIYAYLCFSIFHLPPLSQAQIDFLRKELSKKETSNHEKDLLAVIVTQIQQLLEQQQQKQKEQQLIKYEQCREDQQPHFEGKAYVCLESSKQARNE